MNIDDALNILGVKEEDDDLKVEASYKKLLNEYQMLHNNNYQPANKQLYKTKIEEVKSAYNYIVKFRSKISTEAQPSENHEGTKIKADPEKTKTAPTPKSGKKNKEKFLLSLLIIIVVIAISTLLLLFDFYNKTRLDLHASNLMNKELIYKDSIYSNSLQNQEMKILNNYKEAITIEKIWVLYFKDGKPVIYEGVFNKKISSGEIFSPKNSDWDGSMYYYVLKTNVPYSLSQCPPFFIGCVKENSFNGKIMIEF